MPATGTWTRTPLVLLYIFIRRRCNPSVKILLYDASGILVLRPRSTFYVLRSTKSPMPKRNIFRRISTFQSKKVPTPHTRTPTPYRRPSKRGSCVFNAVHGFPARRRNWPSISVLRCRAPYLNLPPGDTYLNLGESGVRRVFVMWRSVSGLTERLGQRWVHVRAIRVCHSGIRLHRLPPSLVAPLRDRGESRLDFFLVEWCVIYRDTISSVRLSYFATRSDEEGCGPSRSAQWASAAELSVKNGDVQALRGLLRGDGHGPAADIYSGRAAMSFSALQDKLLELDPLHMACAKGQREMVRFLLTEVAPWSVMVHDKQEGSTALHTCARFGHADIARDLLGSSALICARDRGDCTARKRILRTSSYTYTTRMLFFKHHRKGDIYLLYCRYQYVLVNI